MTAAVSKAFHRSAFPWIVTVGKRVWWGSRYYAIRREPRWPDLDQSTWKKNDPFRVTETIVRSLVRQCRRDAIPARLSGPVKFSFFGPDGTNIVYARHASNGRAMRWASGLAAFDADFVATVERDADAAGSWAVNRASLVLLHLDRRGTVDALVMGIRRVPMEAAK